MRAFIAACAAGIIVACGPSEGGSSSTDPTRFNLRISTSGNGAVRGAGPDCRGSCTVQYPAGSTVHLAAMPDSSYSFAGGAGACTGSRGCDLTLDADRDVSAAFQAISLPPPPPPPAEGQHRLTVVVQGAGRVTSSPPG